jgi:hypothetical protein
MKEMPRQARLGLARSEQVKEGRDMWRRKLRGFGASLAASPHLPLFDLKTALARVWATKLR